jgi:plasmid maintenance system antidote protein VapI
VKQIAWHFFPGIPVDMAHRFAKVFGSTDQFWINLQASYDRACAIKARGKEYPALKPLPLPKVDIAA